MLIPEVHFH